MSYAAKTNVSADRTRNEIESTLIRYGATGFIYGWQNDSAMMAFQMQGRHIKFVLPMPDPNSDEFTRTPARRKRSSPIRTTSATSRSHPSCSRTRSCTRSTSRGACRSAT